MTDIDGKSPGPGGPDPAGPEEDPGGRHEEEIARLLRLAGPRPAADPERAERVRAAVSVRWRAEVQTRRSRRFIRWIAIPVAAAAVVVAMIGLARWLPRRAPVVGQEPLAALVRVQGPVRRSDGGTVTTGARLQAGTEVSTGAGGRVALKLFPAASLRLDSGTTLRLVSATVLDLE